MKVRVWLLYALIVWAGLVWINYWPSFYFPLSYLEGLVRPIGYNPNIPEVIEALMRHFRLLIAAVIIIFSIDRCGGRGSLWLGIRGSFLVTSLPAGLLLLGAAVLGLGLAGLLQPPILLGCLAAGILSGPDKLVVNFRIGKPSPAAILAAAVALIALCAAIVPEITYDAFAYHLGAPAKYLAMGRIVRLDRMVFTDLPMGLQAVYCFACTMGGDEVAKLLHWGLGVGCMAQVAVLAQKYFGSRVSLWAAAFLAATPFMATQMARANVDLGVMFFTVSGLYWLMVGTTAGPVPAGLFLGGAVAVKLTGIYGLLAAGAIVGLSRPRRLASIFLVASVVMLPWFLRGFLLTGNPVYPFFSELLGGLGWGPENEAMFRSDAVDPSSFTLQYPLALDRLAGFWLQIQHDRGTGAAFGPFALTLLPAAILVRMPSKVRRLAWFCLVYWLVWFVTARDARFFLPAWPAVCVFSAFLLTGLDASGVRVPLFRPVFIAALAVAPLITAAQIYRTHDPAPVLYGALPAREYQDRLIPPPGYLPLLRFAAGQAGTSGRILMIGDVKAPGVAERAIYPSMFDTPHIVKWVRESSSPERVAIKLRQRDVRIIFYNVAGAAYLRKRFGQYSYSPDNERVLREFLEKWLIPLKKVGSGGDLIMGVYRVLEKPGPARVIPLPGQTP